MRRFLVPRGFGSLLQRVRDERLDAGQACRHAIKKTLLVVQHTAQILDELL